MVGLVTPELRIKIAGEEKILKCTMEALKNIEHRTQKSITEYMQDPDKIFIDEILICLEEFIEGSTPEYIEENAHPLYVGLKEFGGFRFIVSQIFWCVAALPAERERLGKKFQESMDQLQNPPEEK